ncbi:hypothetical protein [uncultured Hyphomicrobium sp.]|uniref:hypothetical protein n=1 Tax=uncultured Hyphomicrobium sp. TaxID=194373 RepID=UPI0025E04CA5|nr:hypothetical protein [uncultured Hyphomicrobium sp.]
MFPDHISLVKTGEVGSGSDLIVALSLNLDYKPLPTDPQNCKTILLSDDRLFVDGPLDARVLSFRFVKTIGLKGNISIKTRQNDWPFVRQALSENARYLRISYRGTSEPFLSTRVVATASLSSQELIALSSRGLFLTQGNALAGVLAQKAHLSVVDGIEWAEQVSFSPFSIVQHPNGGYRIDFGTPQPAEVSFRKTMDVVEIVKSQEEAFTIDFVGN